MLTMFPTYILVEKAEKNLKVYYFSTNLFDTTFRA